MVSAGEMLVKGRTPSIVRSFIMNAAFVVIDTKSKIFRSTNILNVTFSTSEAIHDEKAITIGDWSFKLMNEVGTMRPYINLFR